MSIVLATVTYYADEHASRLNYAKQMLTKAGHANFPVVVVVDGSPANISGQLKTFSDHVVAQNEPGLANAQRQAIQVARDLAGPHGIVVWIEAEKHNMVGWVIDLAAPIRDGAADLSLPSRSLTSWHSYPDAQFYTESYGSLVYRQLTNGKVVDSFIGPMAMNLSAWAYFLSWVDTFQKRPGSNWHFLHHPRIAAALSGQLRITNVPVDFILDPRQKAEETGNLEMDLKRLSQLDLVASGAEVAARYR